MQLPFLGTAAAEGYPSPFCECDHCAEARRRGGRSLRLRSALLVNDDLLVDCNDIVASCALYGIALATIETLLITHAHEDHLDPVELGWRRPPFTRTALPMLRIYGPADAMARIEQARTGWDEDARCTTEAVRPGAVWASGRYRMAAFLASHGTELPLIYAIEDGERRVLYSTDTGRYGDATWAAIRAHSYDAVILDETMGTRSASMHMGMDDVIACRQAFEQEGLLRPGAHVIAHHFSHGANPCHEELVRLLAPHGIEVAYDGWRLTL
ncbi:MAG: MBL fold metallo-hydrolase [Chloroflexota bacterium]